MENKLISMIEFVLEQDKLILKLSPSRSGITQYDEFTSLKLDRITNYANFLKRPLELGMFVPCDLKGNVMKKSTIGSGSWQEIDDKKYQQAKERVLFEGKWEHSRDDRYTFMNWVTDPTTPKVNHHHKNIPLHARKTIEDLVQDNLTLTESALKP
jgi:hypothetical protein